MILQNSRARSRKHIGKEHFKPQEKLEAINTPNAITFLILVSRLALFMVFQALIALLANSWENSEKYWLLTATLTNIISIALLFMLFKRDGNIISQ